MNAITGFETAGGQDFGTAMSIPPESPALPDAKRDLSALSGAVVLLVEDDFFIGLDYVEHLTSWGMKVIGPAISDSDARNLMVGARIDAALLDVSIQGGNSFGLAQDLRDAETPFAFVTAFASDEAMFPDSLKSVARLGKPVHDRQLQALLTTLLASRVH